MAKQLSFGLTSWAGEVVIEAKHFSGSETTLTLQIRNDQDMLTSKTDLYDHSDQNMFSAIKEILNLAKQIVTKEKALTLHQNSQLQTASLDTILLQAVSQQNQERTSEAQNRVLTTLQLFRRVGALLLFTSFTKFFGGKLELVLSDHNSVIMRGSLIDSNSEMLNAMLSEIIDKVSIWFHNPNNKIDGCDYIEKQNFSAYYQRADGDFQKINLQVICTFPDGDVINTSCCLRHVLFFPYYCGKMRTSFFVSYHSKKHNYLRHQDLQHLRPLPKVSYSWFQTKVEIPEITKSEILDNFIKLATIVTSLTPPDRTKQMETVLLRTSDFINPSEELLQGIPK